jgi:Mrp family chromosome partitioning ATPase
MSSIPNLDYPVLEKATTDRLKYLPAGVLGPLSDIKVESQGILQDGAESIPKELIKLVHRLFLVPAAVQRQVIAFVGCDESANAHSMCADTARVLALQTGRSVCILDLNEQRPATPRVLGLGSAGTELAEALLRPVAVREIARNVGDNLWSLSSASSPQRTLPLVTSRRFGDLVSKVRSEFHYALIVGPPVTSASASIAMYASADATVLVLGSKSKRISALETVRLLRSMEINVAGAVLGLARYGALNGRSTHTKGLD